jgi:hypothetical protein
LEVHIPAEMKPSVIAKWNVWGSILCGFVAFVLGLVFSVFSTESCGLFDRGLTDWQTAHT